MGVGDEEQEKGKEVRRRLTEPLFHNLITVTHGSHF